MTKDEIALLPLNPRPWAGTADAMQVMENWRKRNHEEKLESGRLGQATRRKQRERLKEGKLS